MAKKLIFIGTVITTILVFTAGLLGYSTLVRNPADDPVIDPVIDPVMTEGFSMDRYVSRYNPGHISSGEAWNMMQSDSGAAILDVRTEASYKDRHVSEAVSVPVETLTDYAAANLPDKDSTIILYCFCGDRGGSALAGYNLLTELGYTNVFYTEPESEWTYKGILVTQTTPDDSNYKIVTGLEAMEIYNSNPDAVLLDVRDKDEFDTKHIDGSILIPVKELESRLSELPVRDANILVYCRSGVRSKTAYDILFDSGYTNVYDMEKVDNWPLPLITQ